ncbi:MAG: nucleotidyl transferase AbiEii/AbiGii toxin family protein [Actinobacteria bacterium]|nr:nucleotidyl transferase AbiEii/AbiGii toxin family protein [Actinomycetota bacterium]
MTDNDRQNTPEFSAELVGAAEHLGIPVLAVEKDYWVTRALRGMTTKHREGFVFKGGTSITKGWRIGRRFSEDIDILVVQRPEPDSVNGRETILKAICEAGARACGAEPQRLHGGKGEHRTVSVAYPSNFAGDGSLRDHVRLELGYSGGPAPSQTQSLTPLLAEALVALGVDISANPDLQPVDVQCLHPGRTLIEKIMILNSKIQPSTTREEIVVQRIARHFYDVHELLGDKRVQQLLTDRATFEVIVQEHLRVSEAFGGSAPRPKGGFATAYAFNAPGAHRAELRDAYTEGIDALYYGPADELPTWETIEHRVHANVDLL